MMEALTRPAESYRIPQLRQSVSPGQIDVRRGSLMGTENAPPLMTAALISLIAERCWPCLTCERARETT